MLLGYCAYFIVIGALSSLLLSDSGWSFRSVLEGVSFGRMQ